MVAYVADVGEEHCRELLKKHHFRHLWFKDSILPVNPKLEVHEQKQYKMMERTHDCNKLNLMGHRLSQKTETFRRIDWFSPNMSIPAEIIRYCDN